MKDRTSETRSKQALVEAKDSTDDDPRPPVRHSSVTEEISDSVSTAAASTTFEKVHLDLDLDVVPGERERKPANQSLTPRSSRMPESARTLDDIPEDLIESHAQSRSTADVSEKTSSQRSRTDGSSPSYSDDFSSSARDKTKEKLSSEESGKSRSSTLDTDGYSTENDISEEIPLPNDSHSESEIEEVKDVQMILENTDAPSGERKFDFFSAMTKLFLFYCLVILFCSVH